MLITNSICFDKYINFTKSKIGVIRYDDVQTLSTQEIKTQQFDGFNTPPKMLLGIFSLQWIEFSDNEHEFNITIEEIGQQQFKVLLTTTPQSIKHIKYIWLKYLLFDSDEALIIKNIKIEEQDIIHMSSNGNQSKIRQLKKVFNHSLSKKRFSKRNVSCFILGYKQEYSTSPPKSDQIFSFFVDSIGEFNENQFQLTFTTLDEQNTIKWVNLNCIEYYQYDQNFFPNEYINAIEENKYSYSSLKSFDSYMGRSQLDVTNQITDIQLNWDFIFYGFNGVDLQIKGHCFTPFEQQQYFIYACEGSRAAKSTFILFKMYNCPKNCEDCVNQQTCQKCKLNFFLNNDGICTKCKDDCLSCDSYVNCKVCEEPYYQYKGQCYLNQPKRTYCMSKQFYPPLQQI